MNICTHLASSSYSSFYLLIRGKIDGRRRQAEIRRVNAYMSNLVYSRSLYKSNSGSDSSRGYVQAWWGGTLGASGSQEAVGTNSPASYSWAPLSASHIPLGDRSVLGCRRTIWSSSPFATLTWPQSLLSHKHDKSLKRYLEKHSPVCISVTVLVGHIFPWLFLLIQ